LLIVQVPRTRRFVRHDARCRSNAQVPSTRSALGRTQAFMRF